MQYLVRYFYQYKLNILLVSVEVGISWQRMLLALHLQRCLSLENLFIPKDQK